MDEIPRPAPNRTPEKSAAAPQGSTWGRRLRVIGREPLAAVLDLALSRALVRVTDAVAPGRLVELQRRLRIEFAQLIKDNARPMRGVSKNQFLQELEHSRNKILEVKERAQKELGELHERSSLLRDLVEQDDSSDRRFAGEHGARFEAELARRFRAILRHSDLGPASSRSLRDALVQAALQASREEWERAREDRRSHAEEEIRRYERRIAKLTSSLEKTESALNRLATLKDADEAGVASIYREVQGLDIEDIGFERKREMLAIIFRANLALQKSG